MALTGANNEEKIWNYLYAKLSNAYGCAGCMGNLFAESALNPKNLQDSFEKKLGYTDETYVTAVDNGTYTNFVKDKAGYGLAQWTYWSRKQNLLNYCKSKGTSIGDLEMQLEFLFKELSEGYGSVLTTLKSATSVLQASNAMLLQYERPADQSSSVQQKRASYGQKYYNKYANKVTSVGNTDNSTAKVSTTSEALLRCKVADWLTSYVGIKEGSAKHKEILSIFNNSGLCTRYKMTVNDAWCATAVSAAFIACGLAGASGSGKLFQCVECYCDSMIAKAKTQGIWVENDAYVPKIGDVILYDWQDSGVGDNTGVSDHVGIVYSVSGSNIKVIEGNMNDTVGYSTITVNGRYIRGFITPDYAKFSQTTTTTNSASTTSTPTTKNTNFPATPFTVQVISSKLKYRSTGSSKGKVLGLIGKGSFTIVEVNSKGWGKLKSGAGWIYLKNPSYCTIGQTVLSDSDDTIKQSTFTEYLVRVTADNLNIRSGAGKNYDVTGSIKDKGIYTIIAESNGDGATKWGKLKSGLGWISLDYCTKI
jgi:hypothetical protein